MLFQIKPPSIAEIRANLVLEKLRTSNTFNQTIHLWKTGRTGSGKTTLDNRLFGTDYFLPSSGRQDCTNEINLIQYGNGLNTYDPPGVGDSIYLENYNRVAFGIAQKNDSESQPVQNLTVAKYSQGKQGKIVERKTFTINDFTKNQAKPDLIYYLVAADKLFLNADRNYLADLLEHHQNIIYVLNIFTDKVTGSYYPTQQNIIDVVNNITDIHQIIVGHGNPIIIPVNCWTGEGISDLITHSYHLLGNKKGHIFSELVQYQQQNTPTQFTNEVKQEILKLAAHLACEEPDDNYSCNQSIHRASQQIIDLALHCRFTNQQNPQFFQFQNLVRDTINNFYQSNYSGNSRISFDVIEHRIDEINQSISRLEYYQQDLLQSRDLILETINENANEIRAKILALILLKNQEAEVLQELAQRLELAETFYNGLLERYNPAAESFRNADSILDNAIREHNFRLQRYKEVVKNVGEAIDEYNRRFFRNWELERFIDEGNRFLTQEKYALEQQGRAIDDANAEMKRRASSLAELKALLEVAQEGYYRLVNQCQAQKEAMMTTKQGILELDKVIDDKLRAGENLLNHFQQNFQMVQSKINTFLESQLPEIETFQAQLSIGDSSTINFLNKIDNFQEELYQFQIKLFSLKFQLPVNRMIIEVLQESTQHIFDDTDQKEYRGKIYQKYHRNGVIFILGIAYFILVDEIDQTNHSQIIENIVEQVNNIDSFEKNLTSNQIFSLLQSQINFLFDESFNQKLASFIA